MIERNRVPKQSAKPKSSILSLIQTVFAIIGIIMTISTCMIAALWVVSPGNFQDVLTRVYPMTTQEPQIVVITATQPLPTSTPTLPPSTSTAEPRPLNGDWTVRAYNTDDVNILVVNGHIVGASSYGGSLGDTGWININSYLRGSEPNNVTFVNVNGPKGGVWGFALQYDGVTVWENTGTTDQPNTIGYAQTLQILSDNSIKELPLNDLEGKHLEGQWAARVGVNDVGLILINGVPVAAGYEGMNFGWLNASDLLFADADNEIIAMVWNFDGEFLWDLSILKDQTIVWGSYHQGAEQIGEVFQTSFIIDSNGNVIP